jgi:hypothetical protein
VRVGRVTFTGVWEFSVREYLGLVNEEEDVSG